MHKNYSRFIFLVKLGLPLIGIFMISLVFLWPYLEEQIQENTEFADLSHPDVVENRMVHPRFLSTDERGRPFEVGAQWGKQLNTDEAELTSPHGKMTNAKGVEVELKSKTGTYTNQEKAIDLTGDVVLTTSDGYVVETQSAHIDINTQQVEGDVPVQAEGPMGSLKSQDGFIVVERPDEQGKIITLKGKSQVIINSKAPKENKK